MNETQKLAQKDPYAFPGPTDPPRAWVQEEAAYTRERERLLQEHAGKFAVVHEDQVFGPFASPGEAIAAGYRHFGDVPLMVREIRREELPDFCPIVDFDHPSISRLR
jgi:hypothetical protein